MYYTLNNIKKFKQFTKYNLHNNLIGVLEKRLKNNYLF